MNPWLLLLASYLLGSIPSSYLAGRVRGIDLREHGSGNLGATNTFRVLGPRVAAPVMLFDVLKGFLPAALFPRWSTVGDWRWALAFGAAAILGHVFSIYMRFRGGKGVATGAGVFLALAPIAVAVALGVWLLVLWVGGMVSLASVLAAVVLAATLFLVDDRPEVLVLGSAIALFILVSHRSNLRRIVRGEEHRFGRGKRAARGAGPGDLP